MPRWGALGIQIAPCGDMTVQSLRSFGKSILGQRSLWALGLGLALTAALPGCVAHAEGALVADYPAEYVETVPARIEYYPSVVYRGSPAYLVDGRWYYRTHDRWMVFRDEPTELRNYRARRGPAYLAPSYRSRQDRWAEQRRFEQRREAEQQREAQRREQERRRAYFEAQRAREHQRAEQQRRFEQQREAQQRADQERRVAEQRGRATRRHDRAHGDQQDPRDQRDRRRYRSD